jgi:hypothetical protein
MKIQLDLKMPNSNYLKLTFKWIRYIAIPSSFNGFIHFPGRWTISPMLKSELTFLSELNTLAPTSLAHLLGCRAPLVKVVRSKVNGLVKLAILFGLGFQSILISI